MSTASLFNRYDLEDLPVRLQGYGVHICEIFLNTFCEYAPSFIALLRERVEEAGLQVYSIHPMGTQFEPQLFSLHPRQRADAMDIFHQVLRAGQALHAEYYVMHGPANLGGTVKNMQLERIGPIVRELCDIAADYGMRIAWENVSWGLYCTPEFGPALRDAAQSDKLCFTLDAKQAIRSGYSPQAYLEKMGTGMANLHICDYRHVGNRVVPALPGKGELDLEALRMAAEAIGYQGPAIFEIYSDLYTTETELLESYAYVKRMLERTGGGTN